MADAANGPLSASNGGQAEPLAQPRLVIPLTGLMRERTAGSGAWPRWTPPAVLAAALLLGLLADLVLRTIPWGLNISLWSGLFALTTAALLLGRRRTPAGRRLWLLGPALCFAAALAWRDSFVLKVLDLLALVGLLCLAALPAAVRRLDRLTLSDLILAALTSLTNALGQWLPLLHLDLPHAAGGRLPAPAAGGAFRGLLLALPLLVVFGGLLIAADAAFADLAARLLVFDLSSVAGHALVVGAVAAICAGLLRGLLVGRELDAGAIDLRSPRLGIVETATVLTALNLLFAAFVAVQFRYLFGGAARVQASLSLTYAEYARSGFFELVAVAALVLPLLFTLDAATRRPWRRDEWAFRLLAGVQLALLAVIVASALQRMRIYQSEYGLTELRLYATAFILWLVVVFAWFALTVLRGRREAFLGGALTAALAAVLLLHALNPDALIARTNLERAAEGRRFDAAYAALLSADAVPALLDRIDRLAPADRCLIATRLLAGWQDPRGDWRSWSWARGRAEQGLQQRNDALHAACR